MHAAPPPAAALGLDVGAVRTGAAVLGFKAGAATGAAVLGLEAGGGASPVARCRRTVTFVVSAPARVQFCSNMTYPHRLALWIVATARIRLISMNVSLGTNVGGAVGGLGAGGEADSQAGNGRLGDKVTVAAPELGLGATTVGPLSHAAWRIGITSLVGPKSSASAGLVDVLRVA